MSTTTHVDCPICGGSSELYRRHPDADLYRCTACSHCFADQDSLRVEIDYDDVYGEEEHRNWFSEPNTKLFDFVERSLGGGPGYRVLDVGCGRGALLDHLARRHPDWQLTGLEVSSFTPPEGVELVVGSFTETTFAASFDAVVSLAVIEHVPDPHAFVRHAVATVRPGGTVILMTLNTDSVLYATSRALLRVGVTGPFDQLYSGHHLNHFNARSFESLLTTNGLEIQERFGCHIPAGAIDFPPRGAVADAVRKVGALGTFAAGAALGRCYLQTLVARAPGA